MNEPRLPRGGDPLVEAINYDDDETVFTCIQCGYSAPAEEAPAPTGSPLDVRARNDEVQVEVPDPRRHRDTRPLRLSPDGARRLAEALEQGAVAHWETRGVTPSRENAGRLHEALRRLGDGETP